MKKIFSAIFVLTVLLTSLSAAKAQSQQASRGTILFQTQNGRTVDGQPSQQHLLPHLVLRRNGELTPERERTLALDLSQKPIPASASQLVLTIETQHGDPDLGGGDQNRIIVWQQVVDPSSLHLAIRFEELTTLQGAQIPTPTDYFRTRLAAIDPAGNVVYEETNDYAFLMENQWDVPLAGLSEQAPGAAAQRLVLYFCDMFPFEMKQGSPDGRLPRAGVESYLGSELLPAMISAIQLQTNGWELPWYVEWKNYRSDEDAKTLSVALTASDTWFHGQAPYPNQGNAAISIRVDGGLEEYDSLTDGIMSTFHHELFHNQQRNISLHFGGHGDVDGLGDAWKVISEGTAVLASSVAQPGIQFNRTKGWRVYLTRAQAFLGGATAGDLNRSYSEIGTHSALYWRFLYEQCGGMRGGTENAAAGMQVIQALLEGLYTAEVVDINRSTDVITSLPGLVGQAIEATPACPFRSYAESLQAFSLAIYKLNLPAGRCIQPGRPAGCGFYDPNGFYPLPAIAAASLQPGSTSVPGEIASSYGLDFIEIPLGPQPLVHSVNIQLFSAAGSDASFAVQVLKIGRDGELMGNEQAETRAGSLEINAAGLTGLSRLVLIITRLDAHESSAAGAYQVMLQAG